MTEVGLFRLQLMWFLLDAGPGRDGRHAFYLEIFIARMLQVLCHQLSNIFHAPSLDVKMNTPVLQVTILK